MVLHLDRGTAELAARQHGVVTRQQLLRIGLTDSGIDRRLAAGRLHRLHRGVYLVGHGVAAQWTREMAALLACGDGAILSHWAAAHVWALPGPAQSAIDVTLVGRAIRGQPGIRVHRTASLHRHEIRSRHGVALTSPARTILDLAGQASATSSRSCWPRRTPGGW